jgi:hypothetical protein
MNSVLCFHVGMRALRIAEAATVALGLQDEIRRSEESRYDHRLHGVLLVAQGMTCPDVAGLLGDAPRSVENWRQCVHHRYFPLLDELVDAVETQFKQWRHHYLAQIMRNYLRRCV